MRTILNIILALTFLSGIGLLYIGYETEKYWRNK
jgi:hypothetical protein